MLCNRIESIFSMLDRGTIFNILSFVHLQDMVRVKKLRHLYLSLESDRERSKRMDASYYSHSFIYFSALHIRLLIQRMAKLVEEGEVRLVARLENRDGEEGD
jgi:hypothetical protein